MIIQIVSLVAEYLSVGGRDFPHLPRPALRPTQPPIKWVPCLSRG